MILEIDNVELSFDNKKILYAIYLRAETGKVTSILGRNGCGKSVLLKILFGSLSSKYSTVRIDGVYQKKKLFSTGKIAYLPQQSMLPKTIKLKSAFALFRVDWGEFIADFPAFSTYHTSRVNSLSSGEVRVVETYLILSSKKEIILLDEPFSFISPLYVEKIKHLINEKKKQTALLITDHFYRDILELSDRIYLIKNGYSKTILNTDDLENEGYLLNQQQR